MEDYRKQGRSAPDLRRTPESGSSGPAPAAPVPVAGAPSAGAVLSPAELALARQQWLDLTTPEERAQVSAYFTLLAQQRQLRGLAAFASPWGIEDCLG